MTFNEGMSDEEKIEILNNEIALTENRINNLTKDLALLTVQRNAFQFKIDNKDLLEPYESP